MYNVLTSPHALAHLSFHLRKFTQKKVEKPDLDENAETKNPESLALKNQDTSETTVSTRKDEITSPPTETLNFIVYIRFFIVYLLYIISQSNRFGHVSIQAELATKFNIGEAEIGGIMTMFYIPYIFSSLFYGYIGDRYSRKKILVVTTYTQGIAVLLSSLCTSINQFYACKMLLAVSQSAFMTISPVVIGDMFPDEVCRTKMLGVYYTAGGVGVGVGIVSMSVMGSAFGVEAAFVYSGLVTMILASVYCWVVPDYKENCDVQSCVARKRDRQGCEVQNCEVRHCEVRSSNVHIETGAEQVTIHMDSAHSDSGVISEYDNLSINGVQSQDVAVSFPHLEGDPKRQSTSSITSETSVLSDIRYLTSNKTYMFTIFGAATAMAVVDTCIVWYQEILRRLTVLHGYHEACIKDYFIPENYPDVNSENFTTEFTSISGKRLCTIESENSTNCDIHLPNNCTSPSISSKFGALTIVCGVIGTLIGVALVKKLFIYTRNAGPLVASYGQLLSGVTMTFLFVFIKDMPMWFIWTATAIVFSCITSCVAIFADVISKVVISSRRSLAFSFQNFIVQSVGTSFPPWIVGFVADFRMDKVYENFELKSEELLSGKNGTLEVRYNEDHEFQLQRFNTLKTGLLLIPCYAFLSSIMFHFAAKHFVKDEGTRNEDKLNGVRALSPMA